MSNNTVCPSCLMASYHPKDIEHRFCSACSVYYKGHPVIIEEVPLSDECAKLLESEHEECSRVHYHLNGRCLEVLGFPDGRVECYLYDSDTGEWETILEGYTDWWQARQKAIEWATPMVSG